MTTNQIYPDAPLPKSQKKLFFGVACGIYLLFSLVFLPLSIWFGSDIIFRGTYLYEIFTLLCVAAELAAFCWVFAYAIGVRFTYGQNAAVRCVLYFAAADVLRYVISFIVSWRMEGIDAEDLVFEIVFLLIYVLLDVMQVTIILLITHLLLRRSDAALLIRRQALSCYDGSVDEDRVQACMPSRSIFALRGVLHTATLCASGLIAFIRVGGRIISDITDGAPTDGTDMAWMIFYYLTDIAIAVLCAAVVRWICIRLCCPTESRKNKQK